MIFKPWVKACKKRKRESYLRTWGLQGTFLTYWVPIYHILGSFMWEKKSQITPKLPSFKIFDSFNFYWQKNDSKKIHSKKYLIIHSTEIFIQIKNWWFIQNIARIANAVTITLYSRVTMQMLILLFSIVRNEISVSSIKYQVTSL